MTLDELDQIAAAYNLRPVCDAWQASAADATVCRKCHKLAASHTLASLERALRRYVEQAEAGQAALTGGGVALDATWIDFALSARENVPGYDDAPEYARAVAEAADRMMDEFARRFLPDGYQWRRPEVHG